MDYRRVYAKIDLSALEFNISQIKAKISENTAIMAVIKANAYGHGAVEFARFLDGFADYYGVATVDEAIELRNAGVDKPILLLGYTSPSEFDAALLHDITVTVFSLSDALIFDTNAEKLGKTVKVHVAVDTGMSRIGFQVTEEDAEKASKIFELEHIDVEGVFSHFATADESDKTFAYGQKERFERFLSMLASYNCYPKIRHLNNSAGIMEISGSDFEMVRAGIMLYGLYPSEEMDKQAFSLRPVMELISHISHVKTLPKGRGISYGLTHTTDKETTVATIPVGYADGYPRALSNKGRVLINGVSCPILGRVCMDQMMVDVTSVPDASVGDEVVLLGKSGDNVITAEELSLPAASFNYEFVCGIGHRVPRAYFKDGKHVKTVSYL